MVLVNLEIVIWSARRKMTHDDFGGVDLPPEQLASLGSKNIFDPRAIDDFNRIRSEAFRYLRSIGIRFGSGVIVSENKLADVTLKLEELKFEFNGFRTRFLDKYEEGLHKWVNAPENSKWAHIISNSTVDKDYVANRIRYRWHALKVQPAANGSDFEEDISALPDMLFEEIAQEANRLLKTTVAEERDKGLAKSLNPFGALRDKLEAVSFVDPRAAALVDGINSVLSQMPETTFGSRHLGLLRDLARKLSSPQNAKAYADSIRQGNLGAPKFTAPSYPVVSGDNEVDDADIQVTCIIPLPSAAAPVSVPIAAPNAAVLAEEVDPRTNAELEALYANAGHKHVSEFDFGIPEDLLSKALGY
jgi:hypothetical protein